MKHISSTHNDALKTLERLLGKPAERRRSGLLALEGLHLVDAWLRAGHALDALYLRDDTLSHPEVAVLLSRIGAACDCATVAAPLLAKVSELTTPPEVVAVAHIPPPRPVADPSCILLDEVRDPGNLGTLLRTAAAADVRSVYLSRGCADVWAGKTLRAGMGAQFALSIHERADLPAVLSAFDGHRLVTHLSGSVPLWNVDLRGPCAFVFGNEGAGVSADVLAMADDRVRIPMPGEAESLNVAAAAAICLFERVRQRG